MWFQRTLQNILPWSLKAPRGHATAKLISNNNADKNCDNDEIK